MLRALLSLLVVASFSPSFAGDVLEYDATKIRPSITSVGEWSGSYSIKYYTPTQIGGKYSYVVGSGQEYVWQSEIDMDINFSNSADQTPMNSGGELLTYQFDREILNATAETDYKNCAGLPNGAKYKTIPRQVVLINESLANIQGALSAGLITAQEAAEKEAGIRGLQAKVQAGINAPFNGLATIDHEIVAVIFGKKCGQGDAGKSMDQLEDLTIPVIKVDILKDSSTGEVKKLNMTAVLQPKREAGKVWQGFSFYSMEPAR